MTNTIDNRPVHLYFGHLVKESDMSQEIKDAIKLLPRRSVVCNSWEIFIENLKLNPRSISICAKEFETITVLEMVNMIKTLTKLSGLGEIPIAAAVRKDTNYSFLKEIQKSQIHGIIPCATDFGIDEAVRGATALWSGIPYWPKHIINQLPGARPKKSVVGTLPDICLTARQEQILRLVVERGVSNKIIARTLNIGESTVKLHLGNIFRKYGVKNRTQLALFAQHRKNKKDGMDLPFVD